MNTFLDIIQPRAELIDDLEKTSNIIYNNTNRLITIIGIIITKDITKGKSNPMRIAPHITSLRQKRINEIIMVLINSAIANEYYPCLSAEKIRSCQFWAGGSLLFYRCLRLLCFVCQRVLPL